MWANQVSPRPKVSFQNENPEVFGRNMKTLYVKPRDYQKKWFLIDAIINAAKAVLGGRKSQDKLYYEHSGFPGGLKVMNYQKLLARRPLAPMEKAIKGMLPKGPLGRDLFRNLRVYADAKHPHAGQNPLPLTVQ